MHLSNIPSDLRYTKSHEWVRAAHGEAPDGTVEIGITEHAQSALGDLVFVEVPEVGRAVKAGEASAVVESVKAASDVYSPVSGKVIASNGQLATQPELLNQDPYGAGWMFRVQTNAPIDDSVLMSAADYANYLAEEAK
jgi:glycine cleavage system H protein